ncbi:unnamed protein product [Trichobilharzia regenti]|nr:unnamed protein product [Trichobilharzia regenti]
MKTQGNHLKVPVYLLSLHSNKELSRVVEILAIFMYGHQVMVFL